MLPLSSELQLQAQNIQQRFYELPAPPDLHEEDIPVLALSDFVSDMLLIHPEWLEELHQQPPQPQEWQFYPQWLNLALAEVQDEAALLAALRLFRRRIMVRIVWSQTRQTSAITDTLQQLSGLAESLILAARDWLYQACCREFGTPSNAEGVPQPLLILGMGKLGGGELNFSSDIDLIFAYPENGQTGVGVASWIMPSSLPAWGNG